MNVLVDLGLLLLGLCLCNMKTNGNELARGFNDDINWVTFEDGKILSKEQNKPLMLLIHKSWCGACKALKPQFATSLEIEKLSLEFVMVNLMDNEEPQDKEYSPDGGYIPRILFLDPSGEVQSDIKNENGNESYKYFYHSPAQIVESMQRALTEHKTDRKQQEEL